ncbi:hypothetical protein CO2235_MP60154 [Cupriavidus oxalaticus]|uniref:Uncharacterized protein n=1 Tax=Cupriavidus oxalaticus TaxID=96344 RepID=A0A976GD85_9BURK|nr:hypothetical protein CO2235_MP60154 [Cupriavidus oxalaticus]
MIRLTRACRLTAKKEGVGATGNRSPTPLSGNGVPPGIVLRRSIYGTPQALGLPGRKDVVAGHRSAGRRPSIQSFPHLSVGPTEAG